MNAQFVKISRRILYNKNFPHIIENRHFLFLIRKHRKCYFKSNASKYICLNFYEEIQNYINFKTMFILQRLVKSKIEILNIVFLEKDVYYYYYYYHYYFKLK